MTTEATLFLFLYQAYIELYCDDEPDLCPEGDEPDLCPEDDKPHLCPEDSDSKPIPKIPSVIYLSKLIKGLNKAGPPKEVSINSDNDIDSVMTVPSIFDQERPDEMLELIYLVMLSSCGQTKYEQLIAERAKWNEQFTDPRDDQMLEMIDTVIAHLAARKKWYEEHFVTFTASLGSSLSESAKLKAEAYAATMSKERRKKAAAFMEHLATALSTYAEGIAQARPEGSFDLSSSLFVPTLIESVVTILAPVAKTVAKVFANEKRSQKRRKKNYAEVFAVEKRSKKRRKIQKD